MGDVGSLCDGVAGSAQSDEIAIYTVPKTKIEVIVFESGYREEFKEITTEMADLSKRHLLGFFLVCF